MKLEFKENDTKIIKGVAIILMLMHHLWAFPSRIPANSLKNIFTIFDNSSLIYFGKFGKICVSLFFFLGAYGTYKGITNNFGIIKKIKKIYFSYWKVFLIFIPIGFIFFKNQISYCEDVFIFSRFSNFDSNILILNFLGLYSSFNREWWFLLSYACALMTFPILKKLFSKHSPTTNVFIVIVLSILTNNVFPALGNVSELGMLNNNFLYKNLFCQAVPYISCFWMGIIFAKDNLLIRLYEEIDKNFTLNWFKDVIFLSLIVFLRQSIGEVIDLFLTPLFIIFIWDFIRKLKPLKTMFIKLGSQSTNMWLIHSFFCYYYYYFVKVVLLPKWGILCLGILIVLTYYSSIVLDCFWRYLKIFYEKIIKQIR